MIPRGRIHGKNFNPHSPCGERPKLNRRVSSMHSFQSTLPLRGATVTDSLEPSPVQFQSTLPLRGATNVHFDIRWLDVFQSTLPLRGATRAVKHAIRNRMISIHTPLAGSDWRCRRVVCRICHFNPHSPCGERPPSCSSVSRCRYFNPHSPCGERPQRPRRDRKPVHFNPHSPCGERRKARVLVSSHRYFNPHSPCGERPDVDNPTGDNNQDFNPHSPCGERPGR